MLLGLGLIVSSYLLVYSARADWTYEGRMNRPNWSRYHLQPQLGLALLIVGGLPRWAGRWGSAPGTGLTRRQAGALLGLVVVLFVTQLPRTLFTTWGDDAEQQQRVLRLIDETDARCREHRIGRATARQALAARGELDIPGCEQREDGWEFLRGSPDPDPSLTPEQARSWLGIDEE
jgi:hypothetical protein